MPKSSPIIEINGKKYDAETGRQLSVGEVEHTKMQKTRGQVIDGFSAPHRIRRSTPPANELHAKPQKTKKLHPLVAHSQPKKPIKSVASKIASSSNSIEPASDRRRLFSSIKPERLQRATENPKSANIEKFSSEKPNQQLASVTQVENSPQIPIAQPSVASPPVSQPQPRTAEDILENSNKEKKPNIFTRIKQRQPKLLPTAAAVAVFLMLAGYVTYLNLPNIALRVAASRAGFEASLPGYKPAGFSFSGPIAYSPGQITINFSSNSDDRSFSLAQRESTWDSQSLLDNFVVRENKKYLTFQEKGLTVYVYDGSNATWVDGGIWYTISGDSLLSSEQLLKVAGSL